MPVSLAMCTNFGCSCCEPQRGESFSVVQLTRDCCRFVRTFDDVMWLGWGDSREVLHSYNTRDQRTGQWRSQDAIV